jgi:hypothetical protein
MSSEAEAILIADRRRAPRYVEDVIRAAVVLTMCWGVVASSVTMPVFMAH